MINTFVRMFLTVVFVFLGWVLFAEEQKPAEAKPEQQKSAEPAYAPGFEQEQDFYDYYYGRETNVPAPTSSTQENPQTADVQAGGK